MMIKNWLKKRKFLLTGILTTLLATGLLYWCFRKINWQAFLENIESIKWYFLMAGVGATLIIIFIKAAQIRVYLPKDKRIPFKKLFQVVSIMLMTVSVVPFWGGHALFVYLLGQREKVGKTLALSVVTLDQVLDGFGKLSVFVAAALVVPLPQWMKDGVRGFVFLFLTAYVVVFVLAYRYRRTQPRQISGKWGLKKLYSIFTHWAYHLRTIHDPKRIFGVIFFSVLMRVFEVLAVYFVQLSFGISLPFYAPILIVAALSLATVLPLAPGRLGVFEAAIFATYQTMGVNSDLALAMALFIHLVHSLPLIITGYIVSVRTGFRRKEVTAATSPSLEMPIAEF